MNLSPLPIQKFFGNNGRPLAGGLLFTYAAGTSDKIATYTDASGNSQNTNPIVLDFRGECRIWLDPKQSYKFVLSPPGDTDPPTRPIWTVDDITVAPQAFDNAAVDIGSVNNISLNIPQISSPEVFTRIVFKAAHTNTGPTTLQINGGTARDLTLQNTAQFSGGEIQQGGLYEAIYDGARWQLQGPTLQPPQMRTPQEAANGVTPVNYFYMPGDPRRYGAKFDNSTDDTVAIQTAFDSGHDVTMPAGTAVISDTLFARVAGIVISGAGPYRTILRQTVANKHGIRVSDSDNSITNSHNITIRDLQVTGIHQTGSAEFRGIYVPGPSNITIIRCAVIDCFADSGISVGFISDGNDPSLLRSQGCRVIDCNVENIDGPGNDGIGIELIGAIDITCRGCITKNTKRFGIRVVACTRATIVENFVYDFARQTGDAGINVSAGTIPGPAFTESIDNIISDNHIVLDTPRTAGTYLGVQILGAKRAIIEANRITMSDVAAASTDFRAIDVQTGSSGISNDSCVISNNVINGTDLNVGISCQGECNNLKISGNIIEGFVNFGIRSTSTALTGEAIGNTLIGSGGTAQALSKSVGGAGAFVCWGNTTNVTGNRPFVSNNDDFTGTFGGFTRIVSRSGDDLNMNDIIPHPIETGDRIQFTTTGTLPSPLAPNTDYYAIRLDNDSIRVASTVANAVSGTNIGLTNDGTGSHTVVVMRGIWANAVRS